MLQLHSIEDLREYGALSCECTHLLRINKRASRLGDVRGALGCRQLPSNSVNGLCCAQLLPSSQGVAGPLLRCARRGSPRKLRCEQLVNGRALCALLCRWAALARRSHALSLAHLCALDVIRCLHMTLCSCLLWHDLLLARDPLLMLALT